MAGQWSKVEIAIKVTDQPDGYINVWENGRQVLNYAGLTDNYGGTRRTIAVGGYARMQGYSQQLALLRRCVPSIPAYPA